MVGIFSLSFFRTFHFDPMQVFVSFYFKVGTKKLKKVKYWPTMDSGIDVKISGIFLKQKS